MCWRCGRGGISIKLGATTSLRSGLALTAAATLMGRRSRTRSYRIRRERRLGARMLLSKIGTSKINAHLRNASRILRNHRARSAPAAWARSIARATPSSNRDVAIKVLPRCSPPTPSAGAFRARSAGARLAESSQHRRHLRPRKSDGRARARAGAGRGPDAGGSHRARADSRSTRR